jgi:hypothetical protein
MARTQRRAPGREMVRASDLRGMSQRDLMRVAAALRQLEQRDGAGQDCTALEPYQPAGSVVAAHARHHRAPLAAAAMVSATDLAVMAAHAGGWPWGYVAVLGAAGAAGGRVAWKYRPKAKRRPRARRVAYGLWGASSAAALAATAAGVASGPGQVVMLGGGLAVAAPYLYHRRRRAPAAMPAEQAPAIEGTDPRIEAFVKRFGAERPCKDAAITSAHGIQDGFQFDLELAPDSKAVTADVVALAPHIAALYDVPADQVSVEDGLRRSARRARISVLTAEAAFEREDPWDGASTYDPEHGWFRLGRFVDAADTHWLLHKPGSGAAPGVLAGVIGSGKTGTANVIACEAGLAKLCTVCGTERSCGQCDPRRIAVLWMGDPQMQPFGVWRGRADLCAWGPAACVHMLLLAHTAMRARAAHFGEMRWTDHLGRENHGKGWFDPSPEYPVLFIMIDEWPLIIADPDLRKLAIPLAASLVKEGRKVGVSLNLLTQIPDLSELGDRAVREMLKSFNALSHRTDGLSKSMLGIRGNPALLAPGVHGLGYLSGPDQRPAATFRTKHLPEYLKPGQQGLDVREIAEWISQDPAPLDVASLSAIGKLGYYGRGQVLDGELFDSLMAQAAQAAAQAAQDSGTPAPAPSASHPAPAAAAATPEPPPTSAAVHLPLLATVLSQRGEMDLFDVSEAAGVDAFEADRALAALAAAGMAVQVAPGTYRTTMTAAGEPQS